MDRLKVAMKILMELNILKTVKFNGYSDKIELLARSFKKVENKVKLYNLKEILNQNKKKKEASCQVPVINHRVPEEVHLIFRI
jgi:hypothetical protein